MPSFQHDCDKSLEECLQTCSQYCGSWYYTKSILIFILMALFLCFEMALQVSPGVMAKNLIHSLNISPLGLGIMSGCYFITYAFMQIPSGLMYDRTNFRILVTIAILICAIGTALFGLASTIYMGILARLLMGFGSAFAFLAVLTVAARYFPSKYFALLTGCAQLLAAIGGMAGNLPIAWMVKHYSWRPTLFTLACIGLILALCVWCFIRQPRHPKDFDTTRESVKSSLSAILRNRQTWFVGLYAFFNWAPVTAFAALWGVPFLEKAYQLSSTNASALIALIWLGIGTTSPLLGGLSDKIGRRKPLLVIASLIGLVSIWTIIYCPSLSIPTLAVLLFFTGIGSAGQILSFAVVKDFTPTARTSTAIGFNNMAVVASGFLVQTFVGQMLNPTHLKGELNLHAFQHALFILPLCFGACILITFLLIRETFCQNVSASLKETLNVTQTN